MGFVYSRGRSYLKIKVMKNINKNTNEKYEQLADRVIAFATVTGFISLCSTIALAIVTHMSMVTMYSAIVFLASIGIGKLGSIAFSYYTPHFICKIVVEEEQ
jgi:hypothetical protein